MTINSINLEPLVVTSLEVKRLLSVQNTLSMFRLSHQNCSEAVEEIESFTMNLLRRTRPYLSENQPKIVAGDLISRASVEVGYQDQEISQPFQFAAKYEATSSGIKRNVPKRYRERKGSSPSTNNLNGVKKDQVGRNSVQNKGKFIKKTVVKAAKYEEPKVPKLTSPRMIEVDHTRKRSYRCSSCPNGYSSVSTSLKKSGKADILHGAPALKKKRASTYDPQREGDTDTKKQYVPDVFKRLYSMSKIKHVHKKREPLKESKKKNLSKGNPKARRSNPARSLNSVDNLQRELSRLTL